jgi:hypothetical protein
MTDETTRSRRPAGHGGLFNSLLAVVSALVDFSRAAPRSWPQNPKQRSFNA